MGGTIYIYICRCMYIFLHINQHGYMDGGKIGRVEPCWLHMQAVCVALSHFHSQIQSLLRFVSFLCVQGPTALFASRTLRGCCCARTLGQCADLRQQASTEAKHKQHTGNTVASRRLRGVYQSGSTALQGCVFLYFCLSPASCLPACLLPCLPTCLPACLPASLFACPALCPLPPALPALPCTAPPCPACPALPSPAQPSPALPSAC